MTADGSPAATRDRDVRRGDSGDAGEMGMPQPVRSKPPLPPGAERRRFERYELLAQVQLHHHGEVAVLPVVNISAGGVLMRVEHGEIEIALDETVTVFLEVTELAEPIAFAMDATVVRIIDGKSIAVMWTSTNAGAVTQLAKLLEHLRTREE